MPTTTANAQATLRINKLRDGAALPAYQSEGAAGMDLVACIDAPVTIEPGAVEAVPTGIAMAIPSGHEGQVRPRSGLAFRHGVTVVNSPGTIDEDYRGEVIVGLINHGGVAFTVEHGMRIAQLVIAPVTRAAVEETEDLDETVRGAGGFGSTGLA